MAATPVDIYKEHITLKNHRINSNTTSDNSMTSLYVASHLTQTSDPVGIYSSRVKGRHVPLENPARESTIKKRLEGKRQNRQVDLEKKGLNTISKKEAKRKGIWAFDETQVTFINMLPLHRLWMDYISELLGLEQPTSLVNMTHHPRPFNTLTLHAKLVKADLHGSLLTVIQNKNPSLIGLSGIVILDTANTVTVVTMVNKLKKLWHPVIPKPNAVFAFSIPSFSTLSGPSKICEVSCAVANIPQSSPSGDPVRSFKALDMQYGYGRPHRPFLTVLDMPHIQFELYGNQFRFHPADRATRKFKHKETLELL
ncbi:hypothetical protein AMATHDRAFT_43348 [Amanita thiersii Skay4041]|uniref:Uncharacterized protein n=1 Tax=Amanita thiersii Skay4041 TaxID=703135 RepID=A0A2A9NGM7_9AGAR|nr:hypothetical protein AMATHDRAFT_43348 [Amanita thiersii Skay4041]